MMITPPQANAATYKRPKPSANQPVPNICAVQESFTSPIIITAATSKQARDIPRLSQVSASISTACPHQDSRTQPETIPHVNAFGQTDESWYSHHACEATPTLVTVFSLQPRGYCCFQNGASRRYFGELKAQYHPCGDAAQTTAENASLLKQLGRLLCYEDHPDELANEMLSCMECGDAWTRVIMAPATMQRQQHFTCNYMQGPSPKNSLPPPPASICQQGQLPSSTPVSPPRPLLLQRQASPGPKSDPQLSASRSYALHDGKHGEYGHPVPYTNALECARPNSGCAMPHQNISKKLKYVMSFSSQQERMQRKLSLGTAHSSAACNIIIPDTDVCCDTWGCDMESISLLNCSAADVQTVPQQIHCHRPFSPGSSEHESLSTTPGATASMHSETEHQHPQGDQEQSQDNGQLCSGPPAAFEQGQVVWHEITAKPIKDPDGRPCVLLLQRDVTSTLKIEQQLADLMDSQLAVMSQIFPCHVIQLLSTSANDDSFTKNINSLARSHENVTILFMDIVGYTSMSEKVEPVQVMAFLNQLFSHFDRLVDLHGVHKVETAGDCYIVSSGLMATDENGFLAVMEEKTDAHSCARKMFRFAQDMLEAAKEVRMPHDNAPVSIRIGLHTGPCVSGLIGTKLPKFSIFGDTMNTASRMESTCVPGHIHVSAATRALLFPNTSLRPTGGVVVKGKGLMETFLWSTPAPVGSLGYSQAASSSASSTGREAVNHLPGMVTLDPGVCASGSTAVSEQVVSVGGLDSERPSKSSAGSRTLQTLVAAARHIWRSDSSPTPCVDEQWISRCMLPGISSLKPCASMAERDSQGTMGGRRPSVPAGLDGLATEACEVKMMPWLQLGTSRQQASLAKSKSEGSLWEAAMVEHMLACSALRQPGYVMGAPISELGEEIMHEMQACV